MLGTLLISQNRTNVVDKLTSLTGSDHVPHEAAEEVANSLSQHSAEDRRRAGDASAAQFQAVQDAFALSSQTVFYVMAGAMAVAFLVALIALPKGKAPEIVVAE